MQTKSIPFTFVREGYFYFSRRVPSDLLDHYRYPRIVQALRTQSPQEARSRANLASAQLETFWAQLRLSKPDVFGMKFLRSGGSIAPAGGLPVLGPVPAPVDGCLTLSEALTLYVNTKGKGRGEGFAVAPTRACSYVNSVAGDKPLNAYTRKDALALRDWLVKKGLSGSSVTRNFSYVKSVFNFASAEHGLDLRNPFTGVYHDRSAGVEKRIPIPLSNIRQVQAECVKLDDEIRWLIALVSDTGMRLAEAAGLLTSDFVDLHGPMPHIRLIKHPWRGLKTESSERIVPLAGISLWAARRILASSRASQFAFPRYNKGKTTLANSASAALNKWMAPFVPDKCTMHSFRHSMRDRLRAVQCPFDIVDAIGGWTTEGVGQGYGNGYPIEILADWLAKAVTV